MSNDPTYGRPVGELDLTGSATRMFPITPGSGLLAFRTRGVYVGTSGDLVVSDTAGNETTFANVPAGALLPIRVDRVLAASTADDIVGLY